MAVRAAYEIPHFRFSLPAGGAVNRGRFVAIDANGNGIVATAATDPIVGVSQNMISAPSEGFRHEIADQVLEVQGAGISIVEASATITYGAFVTTDGEGRAAVGAADNCIGIALTAAGAAGEFVTVKH